MQPIQTPSNNSLTLITQIYYMLTVTFYNKYRSGITGIYPFIVPALIIIIIITSNITRYISITFAVTSNITRYISI